MGFIITPGNYNVISGQLKIWLFMIKKVESEILIFVEITTQG